MPFKRGKELALQYLQEVGVPYLPRPCELDPRHPALRGRFLQATSSQFLLRAPPHPAVEPIGRKVKSNSVRKIERMATNLHSTSLSVSRPQSIFFRFREQLDVRRQSSSGLFACSSSSCPSTSTTTTRRSTRRFQRLCWLHYTLALAGGTPHYPEHRLNN